MVCQLLIDAGADVHAEDMMDYTPLDEAELSRVDSVSASFTPPPALPSPVSSLPSPPPFKQAPLVSCITTGSVSTVLTPSVAVISCTVRPL